MLQSICGDIAEDFHRIAFRQTVYFLKILNIIRRIQVDTTRQMIFPTVRNTSEVTHRTESAQEFKMLLIMSVFSTVKETANAQNYA
ncbi:hypothetical protein WI23_04420 [Burkholderia oklahomensis C6786]|nr:hypothetical protein WI23_04420 [Burkholderia oklahomensis C6786]KUY65758.1 hypothetical protein WI23_03585 [Burkholderia oklahomensis C6786]